MKQKNTGARQDRNAHWRGPRSTVFKGVAAMASASLHVTTGQEESDVRPRGGKEFLRHREPIQERESKARPGLLRRAPNA